MLHRKRQRVHGEVILFAPLSHKVIVLFLAVFATMLIGFLLFGTYTSTVQVKGTVILDRGLIRISAPNDGVINRHKFIKGQKVFKNQKLFEINSDISISDNPSLSLSLGKELNQEWDLLHAQIKAVQARVPVTITEIQNSLLKYADEKASVLEQIETQKEREILELETLDSLNALFKDEAASKREVNNQKAIHLSVQQNSMNLAARLSLLEREIINTESRMKSVKIDAHEKIRDLQLRLSQIETKKIQNSVDSSQEILTPLNGHIADILVKNGQRVSKLDPLATLIPEQAQRIIELFVPAEKIGLVKVNQNAIIRYDGFPYRQYGTYDGRVHYVSDGAILSSEIAGYESQESSTGFIIQLKLDHDSISNGEVSYKLKPGMTAAVDIQIEKQKFWNLLVN